jgi:hypothetical protein
MNHLANSSWEIRCDNVAITDSVALTAQRQGIYTEYTRPKRAPVHSVEKSPSC